MAAHAFPRCGETPTLFREIAACNWTILMALLPQRRRRLHRVRPVESGGAQYRDPFLTYSH
jgi:hypothetical protein